ncbi:hypothetical protein [Neobacillus jeddahensis]|nr:hypothetical protein [Neobacillus jeddahensis]
MKQKVIHLGLVNSRVDYFFWLNDRIATTRLAKAIVIMNVSNTVMQHHLLSAGSVLTTLEKSYSIALLLYHHSSKQNVYSIIVVFIKQCKASKTSH